MKLEHVISMLYPRRCPVCDEIVVEPDHLIHQACLGKFSPVGLLTCKKCGKEVLNEGIEYCLDCSHHKRSFESGMALLNYNESAKHSMAAIKYRNKREYLDFFAEAIHYRFCKRIELLNLKALVPVPVHPSRRRTRGYNQAEELAKRLEKHWGIPMEGKLLLRKKKTIAQRDLNPGERLKNLQEAFSIKPGAVPKRVLLVDDIYTTGSTVEACTRVLMEAGVEKVYVLTICIGHG